MLDKQRCLTLGELEDIEKAVAEAGRIWSVDFSERFEVPEIASITGHSLRSALMILETYLPRTRGLARSAMQKLERGGAVVKSFGN
ncbi:MAG: hypothetical protein MRY74_13780 [Neomegalonema sp.]|nr:hypothetical protein [Neomegalonema sp.]